MHRAALNYVRTRPDLPEVSVATSEQASAPPGVSSWAMDVPEYDLPEAAIAQQPTEPRDAARLLDATDPRGRTIDRLVRDLPLLVRPGDVLVVNTSRVMPARLRLAKPTGGVAEVLLLEPDPSGGPGVWQALVRPGRRLAPGTVALSPPLRAQRCGGR